MSSTIFGTDSWSFTTHASPSWSRSFAKCFDLLEQLSIQIEWKESTHRRKTTIVSPSEVVGHYIWIYKRSFERLWSSSSDWPQGSISWLSPVVTLIWLEVSSTRDTCLTGKPLWRKIEWVDDHHLQFQMSDRNATANDRQEAAIFVKTSSRVYVSENGGDGSEGLEHCVCNRSNSQLWFRRTQISRIKLQLITFMHISSVKYIIWQAGGLLDLIRLLLVAVLRGRYVAADEKNVASSPDKVSLATSDAIEREETIHDHTNNDAWSHLCAPFHILKLPPVLLCFWLETHWIL